MSAKKQENTPRHPSTKRRKYDAAFKAEVLKMIDSGQSIPSISQSLSVGENLLYRWKSQHQQHLQASLSAAGSADPVHLVEEIESLRQQVKQLEIERDILKKAISIFSRSS